MNGDANSLRKKAAELQAKAEPYIDLARRYEQAAAALEGRRKEHLSEDGRKRVVEANRKLWVSCSRTECKGVRHRRTHPHIRGSKLFTMRHGKAA